MNEQRKTEVRPVKVHVPDPDLGVTIRRGVGFRASDSLGWRGPTRKTYAEARRDKHEHEADAG